jgi:alkanesulfonate monooxygenase SsuD/methylene tetrahydromethanopterin reductase-like flavin-dependent oxidoreductase (luciferase family)
LISRESEREQHGGNEMKIGILGFVSSQTAPPGAVAQKAEALGFESFYLPEHPKIPLTHKTR